MNENLHGIIKAKLEDMFDVFNQGLIKQSELERRIGAYYLHVHFEFGIMFEEFGGIVDEVKQVKGYK